MKKNKNKRILILLIIVTLILFGVVCYLKFFRTAKVEEPNNIKEPPAKEPTPPVEQDVIEEETEEERIINQLKEEDYYLEVNLDRYLSYRALHLDKTNKDIISDVNSNIDKDFYTDIKNSDLEKGTLLIVNKYYALSSDYVPDLVTMENTYTSVAGAKMQKEAYEHFKDMVDNAKLEDIKLYSVSAYRSYNTQNTLYTNYVKRDGVDGADRYSARPGHSEHQTGLAADINTASSKVHFENTKEYSWLIANSYKYGFILRYPENKEYLTGYKFEPWHYRYVGVEAATYIHEHNITYDEYYAYFVENN